ncbi:hypothetical protein TNCV_2773931 [Trichonephila clavipes]|nr:hypothetical protein TNCV_2773931 [Trichonephila clavipes]
MGVEDTTRNGYHDPKCLSARHFRMVREDTGTPIKGTTCARRVADEAVGCKLVFPLMRQSSRRLVCRGRLDLCLPVFYSTENDVKRHVPAIRGVSTPAVSGIPHLRHHHTQLIVSAKHGEAPACKRRYLTQVPTQNNMTPMAQPSRTLPGGKSNQHDAQQPMK